MAGLTLTLAEADDREDDELWDSGDDDEDDTDDVTLEECDVDSWLEMELDTVCRELGRMEAAWGVCVEDTTAVRDGLMEFGMDLVLRSRSGFTLFILRPM